VKTEEKQELAQRLIELVVLLEYPTPEVADRCGLGFEELESRYVRLFINDLGGVAAPPYAGCFLDKINRLEFMAQFSGFCLELGVALDSAQPPDYIPMMVEVLVMLLNTDSEREVLQSLLVNFYRQWPAAFAAAVQQSDDVGIYATVAEELCQILQEIDAKHATSTGNSN
jgi:TorA maturation chaperone TorD